MDYDHQRLYSAENRVADLSVYFALLAVIISCLGLFGLARFTIERRSKEIGIRKILGSSALAIVKILGNRFNETILIAIITSLPLSYLAVNWWLSTFVYHIDLEWWFFLLPSVLVLLIAWMTVGFQTIKASLAHPASIARSE